MIDENRGLSKICPKGVWSVWVSGNWRVTFQFVGRDAELVDYEDYR